MGLGQVEDLLHGLPQPDAEEAARAERDLALHGLEPAPLASAHGLRKPSAAHAVRLDEREQQDEDRRRPPNRASSGNGIPRRAAARRA